MKPEKPENTVLLKTILDSQLYTVRMRNFLMKSFILKAMKIFLEINLVNIQLVSTKYKYQTLINSDRHAYQIPMNIFQKIGKTETIT